MGPDLMPVLKGAKIKGWKKVRVEFLGGPLRVSVPPDTVELTMKKAEVLKNPAQEIEKALDHPLGGKNLEVLIREKTKAVQDLKVAITVSDITRPVPYKGKNGLLKPLLRKLISLGVEKKNIFFIIGTGTHRASTPKEKEEILGKEVVSAYQIEDHDCQNQETLVYVGKTKTGTEVFLNKRFYEADLKIVTGLTESHFMAGASGGRKAVCPGLVDLRTIQKFHSPEFLESPWATNLILEGNPCHEEATAIAQAVGIDLTITVTLDKNMRLTGVFAGDLEEVLNKAVDHIKKYVQIPLEEEFDIVLTHGGYVGRNHYQMAKAAVGALPAVKKDGVIILAADNRDEEPIGGPEYRTLIHLLKLQGVEGYLEIIKSPNWKFTKDQWEPEVWGRVLRQIGEQGLVYCSADIPPQDFALLPGISGYEFLTPAGKKKGRAAKVQEMVQNAVIYFYQQRANKQDKVRVAFIKEGPYAVPIKKEG
ncbi:MAG: nickel-dependent lactate racemase [Thermodesulfobacteriota bacterium]